MRSPILRVFIISSVLLSLCCVTVYSQRIGRRSDKNILHWLTANAPGFRTKVSWFGDTVYTINSKGYNYGKWYVYSDKSMAHKIFEFNVENDQLTGERKSWYPDGKLMQIENGKETDPGYRFSYFYSSGPLKAEAKYLNPSLLEYQSYFRNGNKRYFELDTFADNGLGRVRIPIRVEEHYENGQLRFSRNPSFYGKQYLIEYHDNGNVSKEYTLSLGLPSGTYHEYYPNGKPKMAGNYSDCTFVEEMESGANREKVGIWTYYNAEGVVERSETDDNRIAQLTQKIDSNRHNAFSYYLRGLAYWAKSDYNAALRDFNSSDSISYPNIWLYKSRGILRYYKGDYAEAEADLRKALSFDPKALYLYYYFPLISYQEGKFIEAIRQWDEVIGQEKLSPYAFTKVRDYLFFEKARAELAAKDLSSACSDLERSAAYGCKQAASLLKENCK